MCYVNFGLLSGQILKFCSTYHGHMDLHVQGVLKIADIEISLGFKGMEAETWILISIITIAKPCNSLFLGDFVNKMGTSNSNCLLKLL